MKGLTGEYRHTLDAKGRLFMPSRLLKALGDPFFIFKSSDNCLNVYPREQWEMLEEKLAALPKEQSRELRRSLFPTAQECEPDSQGRILLAQNLREHAELDKNIVIIGLGEYAEIWDANTWDGRSPVSENNKAAMASLGI